MLYYEKFLLGNNLREEQAFLAGCRAMMEIFAHAPVDDYGAILSRQDADWILHLCTRERDRERNEQDAIAATLLKHYRVDKAEFRGLLLNRGRVNDAGEDVDIDGNVCARQPYPYRYYLSPDNQEITSSEFEQLSPAEQTMCVEELKVKLYSKAYHKTRLVNAHNSALMKRLIVEALPKEPEPVLKLYEQALEDESNEFIQDYRDFISPKAVRTFDKLRTWFECRGKDATWNFSDDIPEDANPEI